MPLVTDDQIEQALRRLDRRVVHTPLLDCPRLSDQLGVRVLLKPENLQHTGSFKVRGALNFLLAREADLPGGLATFSAGNHGAATAYASATLGLPCVVCMPPQAVATKVEAVRRYGGEVIFTDDLVGTCRQVADERHYLIMHPFDDLDVIAGHATAGVELAADAPPLDLVLVPVGGGGLISGVAAALSRQRPTTRIIGVEPNGANAMTHALRAGAPQPLANRPVSIADGLTAPFAGQHPFDHVRALVETVLEVPDTAIRRAWWDLMDVSKLLIEPSAAVGLAAIQLGLIDLQGCQTVALLLSGGNVAASALAGLAGPQTAAPERAG